MPHRGLSSATHAELPAKSLGAAWRRGASIIPFSLVGCLLTCIGAVIANMVLDGWALSGGWPMFARRVAVGYAGAVLVVAGVFPWLELWRTWRRGSGAFGMPSDAGDRIAANSQGPR